MEETDLTFTDDALRAIAQKAVERKTGARGLRSIIESLLLDTMFEVPDLDDVTEVVVEKETVEESSEPRYVKSKTKKKKKKKESSLKAAEYDKDEDDKKDDDDEKEAS